MELHDKDRLDKWLDKALQQYGAADARPGLEGRIFANLAANRRTEGPPRKWGWILACATCVILGFSLWSNHHDRLPHTTPIALRNRAETMHVGPVQRTLESVQPTQSKKVITKARGARIEATAYERPAEDPRLPQFPAQRPLSEQERLLKQYVEQFPGEAVVVARMQTEAQKELEKLVAGESSKTDSDQQER